MRAPIPENKNEPSRDKTNKMACVPSEDSDQPEFRDSSTVWPICTILSSNPLSFHVLNACLNMLKLI